MKTNYLLNVLMLVSGTVSLLIISGCSEEFLERNPLDQLSEEEFYKTPTDLTRGINAAYAVMQGVNWHGKMWQMLEIPSDNSTVGGNDPDFSPIDNFTVNADNLPVNEFWTERYRLITQANQILKFTPQIDMVETTRNAFEGEARFLRAYAYFDLVRIYGDVPIVTKVPELADDLMIPRDPVEAVYDLIIADLNFAKNHLPPTRSSGEKGRATSMAAAATLAKVFLTIKDYTQAMDISKEIIESGIFKLMEDFGSNWRKDESDNNAESIFQIQYVGCAPVGNGNALQAFFAPWGQNITKNSDGWGSQVPTAPNIDNPGTTVADIYSNDDLREYHTIMKGGNFYPDLNPEDGGYTYPAVGASRSNINIKKYVIGGGPDVCFMSTPQNYHAIRYADVLLSFAEAACRLSGNISNSREVVDAFNQIRARAGLETEQVITTDMVFDERRKEFAFENQRWYDLLRTDNMRETMQLHGKGMQDFHVLFPIPASELAINPNLTQNPGY